MGQNISLFWGEELMLGKLESWKHAETKSTLPFHIAVNFKAFFIHILGHIFLYPLVA